MKNIKNNKHIIYIIAKNNPSFPAKIINIIARSFIKIDTLNLLTVQNLNLTYINIMLSANDKKIEKLAKQISKIIDTISVQVIEPNKYLEKEVNNVKNLL